MFPGFFCSSQFCQKNNFSKAKCGVFFKDKPKSCRSLCGCFAFSSNFDFSWLSQPFQTFLKPRDSESKGGLVKCPLLIVVLICKEHYFTRQTSLQVSLAINHTILLENLVASTLKLLFLIFEIRMLIFRIFHGTACLKCQKNWDQICVLPRILLNINIRNSKIKNKSFRVEATRFLSNIVWWMARDTLREVCLVK